MTRMRDYFRCRLNNDCYNMTSLKKTFKNVFKSHQKIFDVYKNEMSNVKMIITTTTISNVLIYIFSNYNENENKRKRMKYI